MNSMPMINIPVSAPTCSLQCMFWYDYKDSPKTTGTVNTSTFTLTYDGTGSNILYNSAVYKIESIDIYSNGIHTFTAIPDNGNRPSLEMVINHYNKETKTYLYVCIPISAAGSSATTNALTEIIQNYFPSTGIHPTSSYSVNQFNLNYIIPKTSYFVHKGKYHSGKTNSIYVVFPYNSFGLPSSVIASLTTSTGHLQAHNIPSAYIPSTSPVVMQNTQGTTVNGFSGNGQIYIDCQPTDSEGEIVVKEQIIPSEFYKFNMSGLIYFIVMVVSCMLLISLYQKIKDFFTLNS